MTSGAITATSVRGWYLSVTHPPGTPPNWVFAPVWITLYVLMGVSAWLVWHRVDIGADRKRAALRLWGWQLLLNALWTPAFFGLHDPALALGVMALLLGAVALTIRAFRPLHRGAALLLAPYLAWVCYAAYLNTGFWWLNHG